MQWCDSCFICSKLFQISVLNSSKRQSLIDFCTLLCQFPNCQTQIFSRPYPITLRTIPVIGGGRGNKDIELFQAMSFRFLILLTLLLNNLLCVIQGVFVVYTSQWQMRVAGAKSYMQGWSEFVFVIMLL